MFGGRADEDEAVLFHHFGEFRVLGQEADPRMDGVDAGDRRRRQDRGDVQVALAGRGRSNADRFVGQADVHGVRVGGGMHRDGADAHLAAGAVDAQGDLAAVGDENLFEHGCCRLFDDDEGVAELDWLRVLHENGLDRPRSGRRKRIHDLHRLDDQQGLALGHLSPALTKGSAPGCGARYTVPTIGDFTAPG